MNAKFDTYLQCQTVPSDCTSTFISICGDVLGTWELGIFFKRTILENEVNRNQDIILGEGSMF